MHEYLTADGDKIGKSTGNTVDPVTIVERFGTDALRWWLLRDVGRSGDTEARLITRREEDLANTIGNLVNRTVSMVSKYRSGVVPTGVSPDLAAARERATALVDTAIGAFDLCAATRAVVDLAETGNRYVTDLEPWVLARTERPRDLGSVLAEPVETCLEVARLLRPFLPDAAERLAEQLGGGGDRLPPPTPVFDRISSRSGPTG